MEPFAALTPDRMLDAVEAALGQRSTGRWLALHAMENRVFEIELEDAVAPVIAKFYRPGRWDEAALVAEHAFLAELVEAEVPAVTPIALASGATLGRLDADGTQIWFALFRKARGRGLPELDDAQLAQIGRLLARLHQVGAAHPAPARPVLDGKLMIEAPLAALTDFADEPTLARLRRYGARIAEVAAPLLARAGRIRIHGDCHLGNVLWTAQGPTFVDFDDFLNGPPVQDVWMIVRGRGEEADRQRDVLVGGYEQMRDFDRGSLALVEPLRGMRMIHYQGWIARRFSDPAFPRAFPGFATPRWWADELQALDEIVSMIE